MAQDYLASISKPLSEDKPNEAEKVEETKPTETKAEETKPTETIEKKEEPQVGIEDFVKRLGVNNLEEIESRFKEYNDIKTNLETIAKDKDTLKQELEGYKKFADEAIDPMKYFADEDGFFVETLRKKYPNLERTTASKLVGSDVKDMDDFQALVLSEVVKHSDIGLREDEAEARILKRMGLESKEDIEDMSNMDKKLLKVDAKEAKSYLAREQDEAKKTPERISPADFLAQHQKAKEEVESEVRKAYEPIAGSIVERVKEMVKEGDEELFQIAPDEAYMQELKQYAIEGAVKRGLDTSEASQQEVLLNLKAKFWADNAGKVLKAFETNLRTKWQAEVDAKYSNHKPVEIQRESDTTSRPTDDAYKHMTEGIGKTGW
jgi:hypothetical protein